MLSDHNGSHRLNRRRLLQATLIGSTVGAVVGVKALADERRAPSGSTGAGPAAMLATQGGIEIVVTETPLREYDGRVIQDRADVSFAEIGVEQRFVLLGGKPAHRFHVRATRTGTLLEIGVVVEQHNLVTRSFVLRTRDDVASNRLWLHRDYLHLDGGRSSFPDDSLLPPFEDRLWLATFSPAVIEPVAVSRPVYTYRRSSGLMGLSLHGGYRFELDWRGHVDDRGRDYTTSLLDGDDLLFDVSDSVFPVVATHPPQPLTIYVDSPAFACCTSQSEVWRCC